MPYLHLDLPGRFPADKKRELAARLCRLYADVMQTQTWRPNVGIAELGEDNLFHLGPDGLEPILMVLVEFRSGRPSEYRLKLADGLVDACVDVLGVPRRWVLVEFTPHVGEEIYRDGKWRRLRGEFKTRVHDPRRVERQKRSARRRLVASEVKTPRRAPRGVDTHKSRVRKGPSPCREMIAERDRSSRVQDVVKPP